MIRTGGGNVKSGVQDAWKGFLTDPVFCTNNSVA